MGIIMVNGVSYGGARTAQEISYNNSETEMVSKNVQSAIEELNNNKMNKKNPIGIGSFSMNRKADTTVGGYSHAEGYECTASGGRSHAEGYECSATGESSHAEGKNTESLNIAAHSEGSNTIALAECQHVQGRFNIGDTEHKYAHIVGNGDVNNGRSNAHTLDWDGNAEFAGDVIANGCSGENPVSLLDLNSVLLDGESRTQIPKNADLNNYLTTGYYQCKGFAIVQTLTNCPCQDIFNLDIISTTGAREIDADGWTYIIQIIRTGTGVEWYRKISTNATGAIPIEAWKRVLNNTDIRDNNKILNMNSHGLEVSTSGVAGYVNINSPVLFNNRNYIRFRNANGTDTCVAIGINGENNLHVGEPQNGYGHKGNTYINAQYGDVVLNNGSGGIKFALSGNTNYDGYFHPLTDNRITLGRSSNRWKKIYAGNGTIDTSDERLKHDIVAIADLPVPFRSNGENVLEQLYDKLIPKVYYLNSNSDEEEKLQIGFVAQDISKSLEEIGMSENDMALIDHEYWTDEETGEEKDRYGLIYSQFIALNTHMIQKLRKENEELKNKNVELEERLAKIEAMLNVE